MAVQAGHSTAKCSRKTYFAFRYELCTACGLSCLVRWFGGETSVALEDRVLPQPFITERDVVYSRFHGPLLSFCLSVCLSVSLSGMSSVVHDEGRARRPDFLS